MNKISQIALAVFGGGGGAIGSSACVALCQADSPVQQETTRQVTADTVQQLSSVPVVAQTEENKNELTEGDQHKDYSGQKTTVEVPRSEEAPANAKPKHPYQLAANQATVFWISINGEEAKKLQCWSQPGRYVTLKLKGDYRIVGESEFARGSSTHVNLECEAYGEGTEPQHDLWKLSVSNNTQHTFTCDFDGAYDRKTYGLDTYKYRCQGGTGPLTGRLVDKPRDGKPQYIELVDPKSQNLRTTFVR